MNKRTVDLNDVPWTTARRRLTSMKMIEVQAGLVMGVKKFRTIFVFETKGAMENFVNNGWEFGGQGTAAKSGSKGGSYQGAVQVKGGRLDVSAHGQGTQLTGKGRSTTRTTVSTSERFWRNL